MSSFKAKLANLPPLHRGDPTPPAPPAGSPRVDRPGEGIGSNPLSPASELPAVTRGASMASSSKDASASAVASPPSTASPFHNAGWSFPATKPTASSSISRGAVTESAARPSLDELRDRIARIVARGLPPTQRADPTRGELPFILERTARGPLYVHRARSGAAARVGRAPLVAARDADPAMLALLALDPVLAGCDVRRALFLDTETTGLAGGTGTVPFLIGLAWYDADAGSFLTEQVLLRRLGEEAPMLELVAERVANASMLVTYNGKAFDMPLLRARYVMNRMTAPPEPPHLDLVHVARRIHKARLTNRTLIALEHNVLGRVRIGDTHGEDIVACYAHFLRTGDEEALFGVVEHNAADVLAMVALVGLYGEPLGSLEGEDLAGVARTLRRAGAIDLAADLAEHAVMRGGGMEALRARGEIAKARGDKAKALADFEAIADEVDDPMVRLELAKLYEHHMKSFAKALSLVEEGTGERDEARSRRRARLKRKIERSS
jgi:uncharacterized protein YprB with RNaseH-like and TPR domain